MLYFSSKRMRSLFHHADNINQYLPQKNLNEGPSCPPAPTHSSPFSVFCYFPTSTGMLSDSPNVYFIPFSLNFNDSHIRAKMWIFNINISLRTADRYQFLSNIDRGCDASASASCFFSSRLRYGNISNNETYFTAARRRRTRSPRANIHLSSKNIHLLN